MATILERDAIRLFLAMKRAGDSLYSESWQKLPQTIREHYRDLAADASRVHGFVDGRCLCGDSDCRFEFDVKLMDGMEKSNDQG